MSNELEVNTVKEWTHRGLECELKKNRLGHFTGYVRVPDDRLGEVRFHSSVDELDGHTPPDVEAPGGITYGPDDEGVIGFDTAHAWDVNHDEHGEQFGTVDPMYPPDDEKTTVWTPEKVANAVEDLAEQIAEKQ